MKILIISTFFPPLNSIASLRPYSWAKEWTRLGHEVTVLTMEPLQEASVALDLSLEGWRTWAVPLPGALRAMKKSYQEELFSVRKRATPLSWMKGGVLALFKSLRRRFGIFSGCRMPDFTDLWIEPALERVGKKEAWDWIVSTSGPYAVHGVAHALKCRGQARHWIADYRDLWSLNHIYSGVFPFNRVEKFLEKKWIKKADCITTVSRPLAEKLETFHPGQKIAVIENGFDVEDLRNLPLENAFEGDGKYRIVYTGSIYPGKTNPTLLFQAMRQMAQNVDDRPLLDRLEVVFVGVDSPHLQAQVQFHGVEPWVKLRGFVSRQTALRMQRDAHALLFLVWQDEHADGILTGKLFEYLFSGTPILALGTLFREMSQQLIIDSEAGRVFHEVSVLKEFLLTELKVPMKQKSGAKSEFLAAYTRQKLARDVLKLCKEEAFT